MAIQHARSNALLLCLLVALFTLGCRSERQLTYRLVLPDGYVGWVRVDFGVNSAPRVFRGEKRLEIAQIKVGEDGRARTSEGMVILAPKTEYEFFYDEAGGLRPIPEGLVNHDLNAGGITAMAQDYNQPVKPLSWYFFIGPSSYRSTHPNSEFVKSAAPLPTPGRIRTDIR